MDIPRDKLIDFLTSQALIWGPLLAGHRLRKLGLLKDTIAKPLHNINLIAISPLVALLGIWRLDRSGGGWLAVLGIEAAILALTTGLGAWFGRRFILDRARAGTFVLIITISNIGFTLAGFLTILFLSDTAYPYNALCQIPFFLFVFFIWIPLVNHMNHDSTAQGKAPAFLPTVLATLRTPQSLGIVGVLAGIGLNYCGVPMRGFWVPVNSALVFGGTVVAMFAIGSRMHFRRLGNYHRLMNWVYLAKFALSPLVAMALCLALGLTGLPAGAIFIISCMPTGIFSVLLSTIYDLDVDLANAGYIWSTLVYMILILPLMILALQAPIFRIP
ncbi:MAG: AEC family transporter [bacterium]|nr:AEC family transporter [bacterium]